MNVGTVTVASKRGKKKQAPFIQRLLVLGADFHLSKTSRRANDNGLNPAQENAQTLPLAGRVKAAYYCRAWCQCGFNEIVSL
jgi:hypothetical protein